MHRLIEHTVPPEAEGSLLRNYIRGVLNIPGGLLTSLKRYERGIEVNGERKTVRYVLKAGDIITLSLEDDGRSDIDPVYHPLDILYEDDDLIAVNKISGMPTHPSHNHYYDTLGNALAYYLKDRPTQYRPVNRLDMDTSGIVVVAKHRLSASRLVSALKEGEFKKEYLALVKGVMPQRDGTVEKNIIRDAESIIYRRVCGDNEGKSALTVYKTEGVFSYSGDTLSLVRLTPVTGRTHQLRVHTSYLGCPIVGDGLYGTGGEYGLPYLCLHAERLEFPHPETGKLISLTASIPPFWPSFTDQENKIGQIKA